MKRIGLPLGRSDFESIRENNFFYIDKSLMIEELLQDNGIEVFLFTRPRRFGKTMALSMLSSFFDISKDSARLFDGLKISENRELCEKRMNKSPTAFISFKPVDGASFDLAYGQIQNILKTLFHGFEFLLESEKVNNVDKRDFTIVNEGRASANDIMNSLSLLVRMLYAHYGKKVILLIDEYDVPMAKANANGYYREMVDVMRGMLQVLKDNSCLDFAVVTGCLRIAKESIFTGINNVYSNTILSTDYDEFFGFTENEVNSAFKELEIEDKLDEVKEWYDGYHFGNEDIYCPWDVIYYLRDHQSDPDAKPEDYWANTSGNQIVESFISRGSRAMFDELDSLLNGEYVIKTIDENITYDYLHATDNNLWSILLSTGYLTPVKEDELDEPLLDKEVALRIPNKEIRDIFSSCLLNWSSSIAKSEDMKVLDEALWNGETSVMSEEMTKLLNKTVSYHDLCHEYVYHMFFAGVFAGMEYRVDSNKEYGMGRPDFVVFDKKRKRVAIFEVKGERESAEDAAKQIERKKYIDGMIGYNLILCYGVRFTSKTAEVVLKDRIEK